MQLREDSLFDAIPDMNTPVEWSSSRLDKNMAHQEFNIGKVKELIASDCLYQALSCFQKIIERGLKNATENEPLRELEKSVINLKLKYNDLKKKEINGVLSQENISRKKSIISISLLEMTQSVENLELNEDDIQNSNDDVFEIKVKKKSIEITINQDFDTYSDEDREKLLKVIKYLLEMKDDIKINKIRRGSVIISVDIPKDKYDLLLSYFNKGYLKEHNVVGIKEIGSYKTNYKRRPELVLQNEGSTMQTHEDSPFDAIPNMNAPVKQSSTRGLLEKNFEMEHPVELLSSSHGKIKSLLVTIPVPFLEENKIPYTSFINIIKELAEKFPGRRLTLLAETREERPNERESSKIDSIKRDTTGAELLVLTTTKADDSFSLWAQDAFLIAQAHEANSSVIIAPEEHQRENRPNDGSIAKEVVALHPAGYTSIDFPMPIEGGNVLVAHDFILVGKDEVLHSSYSEEQFAKNFTTVFGKKKPLIFVSAKNIPYKDIEEDILERSTVLIQKNNKQYKHKTYSWRGTEQPIFHIDVFMTLLGSDEAGKQIILIGEPIAGFDATDLDRKTREILNYQLEDATCRIDECIGNLERDLNKYNIKYEILRNPLPLTYFTYGRKTSWYWASYNNCLVEITEAGQKTAWLPSYYKTSYPQNTHWEYLKKYDTQNGEIFRENGFTTHLFKNDFHFLASKNGSLHCMTKCLNRSKMLRKSQINETMLNVKFRLHNDDGTYTIDINNDGEIVKVPIENPRGISPQDTRGIMLKAPENSNKLKIKEGKILHNPMLSVQMLLESNSKYIEGANIIDIDGSPTVNLVGNADYRELRNGQKEFNYSLKATWVSLHVIKSDEDGVPVYYLVINSSPD